MDKEDLEYYSENTFRFSNIDDAFEEYIYEMTTSEIIQLFTDEFKKKIVLDSPSYYEKDGKYYFNSEFCSLSRNEKDAIVDKVEKELKE